MRLRYLHLKDYPPLRDVRVVFHQESLLQRECAINFVVGVNGSGKSSLLRALYTVFHHLDQAQLPPFAVSLAYDMRNRNNARTVLFHHPGEGRSKAFFYVTPADTWPDRDEDGWEGYIDTVGLSPSEQTFVSAEDFSGNNLLREFLPRHVIAYTSGAVEEWRRVTQPVFPEDELPQLPEEELPEERPAGWTAQRELLEGRFSRSFSAETGSIVLPGLTEEAPAKEAPALPPSPVPQGRCLLLNPLDIKFAGLALTIWHAYMEFRGLPDAPSQEKARRSPLLELAKDQIGGARHLADQADLLWPTHLSLTLRANLIATNEERRAQMLCLLALANAAIEHPLNRTQVIVPISGVGKFGISDSLTHLFPNAQLPQLVARFANSASRAANGAEAFCRLCTLQPHLWATFDTLRQWHREGVLKDATATVRRISSDDVLVYDNLSDGELMLLGRMALLLLLQQRDDSLLLLDEPETHFNDFWKREIVDIIDDSLGKTAAQVLVATHTSLTLTDVFAPEITLLMREGGTVAAVPVPIPTFGEDPGEIMIRLFKAPECIGQRATGPWIA